MGSQGFGTWEARDIAARVRGAAGEPAAWPEALSAICAAAGAFGAALVCPEARFQGFPATASLKAAAERYVNERWQERDARRAGLPALIARGFITDEDCASVEAREASPFYQEFLVREGLGEFFALGFRAGAALWCLAVQRRLGEPAFDPYEQSRLLTLWRPLADAATLARQFGEARAQGLADGLQGARHAAIIFDGGGRVLALNALAEALVGGMLDVAQRRLIFADPVSQRRFSSLLACAIRGEPEASARPLAAVARDARGRKAVLRAIALEGFARFAFADARVLLLIGDAALDGSADGALRARFGLTGAEARLADDIAHGLSLAEIAARRHVTYETARTQLRVIFSKTETHRQAELAALVAGVLRA